MEPLGVDGDAALLARCAATLRIAEQLERSRDQAVDGVRVKVTDGTARIKLRAHEDVTVGVWAALREREAFEQAFGLRLEISVARRERPAARR
jgi:exopolyphosphatase/guanosine-5'-triphosphate,3'-diphosphate pyrophosphatase